MRFRLISKAAKDGSGRMSVVPEPPVGAGGLKAPLGGMGHGLVGLADHGLADYLCAGVAGITSVRHKKRFDCVRRTKRLIFQSSEPNELELPKNSNFPILHPKERPSFRPTNLDNKKI